ncbi:MAG: copper resistance protein NlpE [Clostridiales bacterium]|nr:copper resistance protein NlpE [Clostridiales bacterium]
MKKTLAILLALCLMLGMVPAMAEESLAGTYVLDASPLGMPLNVYLTIDENNNFQWTNKLEGGSNKGSGMIGSEDGTYMMLYSDSTADQMKTATFQLDGQNLVFSTSVPYGAASFSPNADEDIYPVAKKMVYTDMLGLYVGALEVEAMGSTIVYECALEMSLGAEFTMVSTFEMMGSEYEYVQQGTFSVADGAVTFECADLPAQTATLADGVLTANLILSSMGKTPRTIVLQKATTADVAGVYTGVKDMSAMGFVAASALVLDAVGGYAYASEIPDMGTYTEEGTFTYADGVITLQSNAEGAAAVEGTLSNDVLTVKMRIAEMVPMATEIAFYSDRIQGVFTAAGEDAAGTAVNSILTLNADATYTINVNDGAYTEEGTFAISASPMGTAITLTSSTGVESTGMVSDTINVNHNVDNAFNTLGFKYEK